MSHPVMSGQNNIKMTYEILIVKNMQCFCEQNKI